MGLNINYTKSHVVIQLRGHHVSRLAKSIFRQQHGTKCLRIQAERDYYIPCVDQLEYLGTVLSYMNFDGQTAMHRIAKAESTYRQLRVPLRSRGPLGTGHRIRLYRAIILSSLTYGIVGVGLTAEVVKRVSSAIAGHMRKILRVYEHGITNEEVLRRADIDPIAMLTAGVERLQQSIQRDEGRSSILKQREQQRVNFLAEQVHTLQAQPAGLHIISARKAEICAVECPECGIAFGTREGLAQHLRLRHPELADLARIPFDRALRSLHGIPVCRFCHTRLHDWSSLSKHLGGGHCGWVKDQVARGSSPDELLRIVAAQEALEPPQPPHDLLEMQSLQQVRELLSQPLDILQNHGAKLRCLAKQCILCAQRVQHSSKIKIHWQQQHQEDWELSKQDAHSGAQSLVALFRRPCHFCGSTAKDSKDHSVKCPALFQFLAARTRCRQTQQSLSKHPVRQLCHLAARGSNSRTLVRYLIVGRLPSQQTPLLRLLWNRRAATTPCPPIPVILVQVLLIANGYTIFGWQIQAITAMQTRRYVPSCQSLSFIKLFLQDCALYIVHAGLPQLDHRLLHLNVSLPCEAVYRTGLSAMHNRMRLSSRGSFWKVLVGFTEGGKRAHFKTVGSRAMSQDMLPSRCPLLLMHSLYKMPYRLGTPHHTCTRSSKPQRSLSCSLAGTMVVPRIWQRPATRTRFRCRSFRGA